MSQSKPWQIKDLIFLNVPQSLLLKLGFYEFTIINSNYV